MLKQCLTLLKHAKTVFNTVKALWFDFSLERAVSCEQELKSLVSWSLSLSLERALSCEQEFKSLVSWSLSLKRALSCEQEVKSLVSRSLSWALSELWARGQEPCELIFLSLELWARGQESLPLERVVSNKPLWVISLSLVSFELRDWLTIPLLGSQHR